MTTRALTFDEAEALGLDGTLRTAHSLFGRADEYAIRLDDDGRASLYKGGTVVAMAKTWESLVQMRMHDGRECDYRCRLHRGR